MADKPEEKQGPQEKQGQKQEMQKGQKQQPAQQKTESLGKSIGFTIATPARVEEIVGRTGMRGEATQVRCKVLDGMDKNKILRRNVKGPIRIGDILMLRGTEIEAQPLTKAGRGAV